MKKITNKEFDKLAVKYTNSICSHIIKNGFDGVEGWVREIMAEEWIVDDGNRSYKTSPYQPVELQDINPSTK